MRLRNGLISAVAGAPILLAGVAYAGDPPVPSGAHPRLYMNTAMLAALKTKATTMGTVTSSLVAACQHTIDTPSDLASRGNADSDTWPAAAVDCALSYLTTGNAQFLTQSIKYWHASLDDDQNLGDGLGCVQGVNTNWQQLEAGSDTVPPVLITVSHDTGYPMRWYGPYLSMTYDWLYSAPGVDEPLRAQTRTCLTAWMDHYTKEGYGQDVPGTNYHAGYLVGKALAAIAIGNDGGADGHLWTDTLDQDFAKITIGTGESWSPPGGSFNVIGGLVGNAAMGAGNQYGAMVGGDWGSWQYGPLSVTEYAAATRALEENGAALPQMDDWVNSVVVRTIYGTLPTMDQQYGATGDADDTAPYLAPNADELDAVLLGPSNDAAASWALYMKQQQMVTESYIWNALAETRDVMPVDYRAQATPPSLWYLSRGSRSMYVRTSWKDDALWAVFESPPVILDHQHFSASSFVLSRGADHLIVDPAPYATGGDTSWESNAITADSSVVIGDYAPSQTPWSAAELLWARGTSDGVYAARSDISKAFDFDGTPSDIPYAHREWTMLPEGEIVTIDRVHTSAPTRNMYISFHTNTGGGNLVAKDGVAMGPVGSSAVAIHAIFLSGGTPQINQPFVNTADMGCMLSCNNPCAACDTARFAVDKYSVTVPGTWAVAIHAIDALATGEAPAIVGSLNDDNLDPAPKQNAGVIGAAVFRSMKQSYVVASSAQDGVSPASMTYGVPGASPGRHVVYDAPEDADGTSSVTAAASGSRCVVTIAAGSGMGIPGHPLMFGVADAADGCAVTADTDVGPGMPPPGSGSTGSGIPDSSSTGGKNGSTGSASSAGSGGSGGGVADDNASTGGCGCMTSAPATPWPASFAALAFGLLCVRRRRISSIWTRARHANSSAITRSRAHAAASRPRPRGNSRR